MRIWKLTVCLLVGLVLLDELISVSAADEKEAERSEQSNKAAKSGGKKGKKNDKPKLMRTIRVRESAPPAAPEPKVEIGEPSTQILGDSQAPQPQAQAPVQPEQRMDLSNVGPTNQIELKPTISITNPPGAEQPVLQVSPAGLTTEATKKDDDEVQEEEDEEEATKGAQIVPQVTSTAKTAEQVPVVQQASQPNVPQPVSYTHLTLPTNREV